MEDHRSLGTKQDTDLQKKYYRGRPEPRDQIGHRPTCFKLGQKVPFLYFSVFFNKINFQQTVTCTECSTLFESVFGGLFFDKVKQYPVLYDKQIKAYTEKYVESNAWDAVHKKTRILANEQIKQAAFTFYIVPEAADNSSVERSREICVTLTQKQETLSPNVTLGLKVSYFGKMYLHLDGRKICFQMQPLKDLQ